MDPHQFLVPYGVIDIEPDHKQSEIHAQRLCSLINCRFTIPIEPEMLVDITSYQQRLCSLIEDLRLQSVQDIALILDYLAKEEYLHLCNLLILCWCLPRAGQFFSKRIYRSHYQEYIKEYNGKLVQLAQHPVLRTFCHETLTSADYASVPVHCIDYLWHHMAKLQYDFTFTNYSSGDYMTINQMEDGYVSLSFCLQYLLEMRLGRSCRLDNRGQSINSPVFACTFIKILEKFITDPQIVGQTLRSHSGQNYRLQLEAICSNPSHYLDNLFVPLSVRDLLQSREYQWKSG